MILLLNLWSITVESADISGDSVFVKTLDESELGQLHFELKLSVDCILLRCFVETLETVVGDMFELKL